jgi:hypothetical protein
MGRQENLDNTSQFLTFDVDLRMGAMENNYEKLAKVTEDLKSRNDQLMHHIFNKIEDMFSFFKSTTIHRG